MREKKEKVKVVEKDEEVVLLEDERETKENSGVLEEKSGKFDLLEIGLGNLESLIGLDLDFSERSSLQKNASIERSFELPIFEKESEENSEDFNPLEYLSRGSFGGTSYIFSRPDSSVEIVWRTEEERDLSDQKKLYFKFQEGGSTNSSDLMNYVRPEDTIRTDHLVRKKFWD